MIVRAAAVDDLPRLAAIARDVYRSVFQPLIPGADLVSDFGEARFLPRFSAERAAIRVAEGAGEVAGFCLVTRGNLDILFVARETRGAGAGALLLKDAEARGAVTLECFAANEAARRFYRRHGWIEDSVYERDFAGGPKRFVRFIVSADCAGAPLPSDARRIEEDPRA